MVGENFQIHDAEIILEIVFVNQKIESIHFYTCSHAKLSPRILSSSPARRKLPILSRQNLFFPHQKEEKKTGEKTMKELKKGPKLC